METWAVFGGKSIGGERRGQRPRHSESVQNNLHSLQRFLFKKIKKE